jgi:hypothetical protein
MQFLKNIAVNLKATGPAAVMAIWVICVTLLGIFGTGEMAKSAFGLLAFFGGAVLISLANKG